MGKHLNINDRKIIANLYAQGKKGREIAEYIGCSFSTIYKEIRKGTINGTYNPEFAHKKHETLKKHKGLKPKLKMNSYLAKKISYYILKEELTLLQVVKRLQQKGYDIKSVQTLYSSIDKGLIPNVTRETLDIKKARIFSKGLLQIPKWARTKLNLKDGDEVNLCVKNKRLIIEANKKY